MATAGRRILESQMVTNSALPLTRAGLSEILVLILLALPNEPFLEKLKALRVDKCLKDLQPPNIME
jgi:hypothetical protein